MTASEDGMHLWSARDTAKAIAGREVSASSVADAYLARIQRYNGEVGAVVSLDEEGARSAAAAADETLAQGQGHRVGPLHGVPMTLKDAHDIAGMRTTVGTTVLDRVPHEDGAVAARLRAAGAILIGHSNVPPWLADYETTNPIFGRTANPWDPARTPGGSSGGAAAALAAGMTPLDIGSDLAGSARLPASFCGVYGLKTTEHRVPLTGFLREPEGIPRTVRIASCIGPLARDLDDLRLALDLISGPDGRDSDVPPVPLDTPEERPLAGLRLAVAPTVPGADVAPDVRARIVRLAEDAAEAGARVEQALPDVDWEGQQTLFADLFAALIGAADPDAPLPDEQRTLLWYFRALQRRDAFIREWEEFFAGIDALLLPAAASTAFPHGEGRGGNGNDTVTLTGYPDQERLLAFSNLAGLPGLAVPAGLSEVDGLPIGAQLVGPRWSEARLLGIAGSLERAGVLPGFQARP
ncbi:amidase [Amycolatopsis cihanbeyliensis]|uniref:Amidase n=1 Tax=Amycolatopsis cihanbeyliensis TaxID=1128664 RepID=A0A542CSJ6_AMYCI|nr:amidase [Amycolatopsis cihanbeyliensis]TQI93791.1 amidase [Amycolatopsis cihanbeyliensis]